MQEPIEEQPHTGTEQDTGTEHQPDPPARPARSLVVAASVVVVALLALGWWQWGASDEAEPTEDLVAGDDAATAAPDDVERTELEPAQVVVALLDGTGDRAARAELIEPGGMPDAAELDEVLNLSDRIGVIYRGAIVGQFDRADATREQLGLLMASGRDAGAAA